MHSITFSKNRFDSGSALPFAFNIFNEAGAVAPSAITLNLDKSVTITLESDQTFQVVLYFRDGSQQVLSD